MPTVGEIRIFTELKGKKITGVESAEDKKSLTLNLDDGSKLFFCARRGSLIWQKISQSAISLFKA